MLVLLTSLTLIACSNKGEQANNEQQNSLPIVDAKKQETAQKKLLNNISLSKVRGFVRDKITFNVDQLKADQPVELVWNTVEGEYLIENLYTVVGPKFIEKEIILQQGTADSAGKWSGKFNVPEGFGGDFTLWVKQEGEKIGQIGYTVDPSFVMEPKSGPVGTEIKIKMEGLGWSTYMRNWQLTYDNKYTGLITGINSCSWLCR